MVRNDREIYLDAMKRHIKAKYEAKNSARIHLIVTWVGLLLAAILKYTELPPEVSFVVVLIALSNYVISLGYEILVDLRQFKHEFYFDLWELLGKDDVTPSSGEWNGK